MRKMNSRVVPAFIIIIAVSSLVGWNHFILVASQGANRLAIIEDVNGDHIGVEPLSDDVWSTLLELYHSGEAMWIGGKVEIFVNIRPDPNYKSGFRFKSETIVVAEVTAEGLQSTLKGISQNLDYWLDLEYSYVFAKVTEIQYSNGEMKLSVQLSANTVVRGDILILSATVTDDVENPIEGAIVTATLGDLEILFLLQDRNHGNYRGTIDTSIVREGIYEIVITANKEGFESNQISQNLIVNAMASSF
jgi:hypothetical protein